MELRNYLNIVFRKLWIILPVLILTMAATVLYTQRQRPVYSAHTTFVARLSQRFIDNRTDATAIDILSRRTEIATTFSEVAKSRRIKFFAAERMGLSLDARKDLTVDSRLVAGTNIIEISTEGYDPVLVSDFTNALGQTTIEYVNNLYEAFELIPLDEAIAPTSPSRPNKTFNYILGGIVGLSLGLGLAFLAESLSIRDEPKSKRASKENVEPEQVDANPSRAAATPEWQQELALLKAQFEVTQKQIEQTQAMLISTQQDAKAANVTIQAFARSVDKYLVEKGTPSTSSNNGNR